jgi:hypothetical protein
MYRPSVGRDTCTFVPVVYTWRVIRTAILGEQAVGSIPQSMMAVVSRISVLNDYPINHLHEYNSVGSVTCIVDKLGLPTLMRTTYPVTRECEA